MDPIYLHSCGVSVPGIRTVDAAEGMIGIEWIDGASVRMVLGGGADDDDAAISDDEETGNSTTCIATQKRRMKYCYAQPTA